MKSNSWIQSISWHFSHATLNDVLAWVIPPAVSTATWLFLYWFWLGWHETAGGSSHCKSASVGSSERAEPTWVLQWSVRKLKCSWQHCWLVLLETSRCLLGSGTDWQPKNDLTAQVTVLQRGRRICVTGKDSVLYLGGTAFMPDVLYGVYFSSLAQKWKCWSFSTAVDVELSLCLGFCFSCWVFWEGEGVTTYNIISNIYNVLIIIHFYYS